MAEINLSWSNGLDFSSNYFFSLKNITSQPMTEINFYFKYTAEFNPSPFSLSFSHIPLTFLSSHTPTHSLSLSLQTAVARDDVSSHSPVSSQNQRGSPVGIGCASVPQCMWFKMGLCGWNVFQTRRVCRYVCDLNICMCVSWLFELERDGNLFLVLLDLYLLVQRLWDKFTFSPCSLIIFVCK